MGGRQAPQRHADVSDRIDDWMQQRKADLRRVQREAEAAGRAAWGQAARMGQTLGDLPDDLIATYGRIPPQRQAPTPLARQVGVGAASSNPTPVRQPPSPVIRPPVLGQGQGLLAVRSALKDVGGAAALRVGNVAGLATGALHTVEDIGGGLFFLTRLANPSDAIMSPLGGSAADQAFGAGKAVVDYVRNAVSDPQIVARDVGGRLRQLNAEVNPHATPVADTFSGELRHNFEVGQNQGELAVAVGSLAVGGPAAKGVARLGALPRATGPAKYLAEGFSPAVAEHLAKTYTGMGHHNVGRRWRVPEAVGPIPLPKALVGRPLPRAISDGPFNVLKPHGITRGDMYRLHYLVDPLFRHARLPAGLGIKSWRGKDLGLEKYDLPLRLWYGSPAPIKVAAGGAAAVAAAALDEERER